MNTRARVGNCGLGRGPGGLLAGAMVLGALGALGACAPELGDDPVPAYFIFDPTTSTVPLPNIILQNQETGLLDYGLPNDPAACAAIPSMPPAMCEFLIFMQAMDGFPSQSTATVPVSAPLDMSTLTPQNLAVFAMGPLSGLEVGYDEVLGQLTIANPASWSTGSTYVVALRGYDDGVRTATGDRVVAPVIYSLLKREESLINCSPDPPDPEDLVNPVVDRECKFFELLADGLDPEDPADASAIAEVEASIIDLERLRQGFQLQGLWDAAELIAQMPKAEIAMIFAFPIHSGPVVELDPDRGHVPEVVDSDTIRLWVNGDLDPATVTPLLSPIRPERTVGLLNVTKLALNDLDGGLPGFDATVIGDTLELNTEEPLVVGDRYVIVLATETPFSVARPAVRGTNGAALVPPPPVAMLRGIYPLFDEENGTSNVSAVDAATAEYLEENRLALAELLDNPLFPLDRDQIGYVFAFDVTAP